MTTSVGDAVWLHERNGRAVRALVYVNPSGLPTVRVTPDRGVEVWDCTPTGPYRYRRIALAEGAWRVVEKLHDSD